MCIGPILKKSILGPRAFKSQLWAKFRVWAIWNRWYQSKRSPTIIAFWVTRRVLHFDVWQRTTCVSATPPFSPKTTKSGMRVGVEKSVLFEQRMSIVVNIDNHFTAVVAFDWPSRVIHNPYFRNPLLQRAPSQARCKYMSHTKIWKSETWRYPGYLSGSDRPSRRGGQPIFPAASIIAIRSTIRAFQSPPKGRSTSGGDFGYHFWLWHHTITNRCLIGTSWVVTSVDPTYKSQSWWCSNQTFCIWTTPTSMVCWYRI